MPREEHHMANIQKLKLLYIKPESVKLAYRANGLDNMSAFSRIRADN
jgi:hypothetical protein